jgi:hypothetical protein
MKIFGADIVEFAELYDKGVIRQDSVFGELVRNTRLEARKEVAVGISLRMLRKKFGDIKPNVIDQINSLSLEQADGLCLAVLDFKVMDDLIVWLDKEQIH